MLDWNGERENYIVGPIVILYDDRFIVLTC